MAFNVGTWDFAAPGAGGRGFGLKDVAQARAQGASGYQLRQLYKRARDLGRPIGGAVQQSMQQGKVVAPDAAAVERAGAANVGLAIPRATDIGMGGGGFGAGGWGFGMKDVTRAFGTDMYKGSSLDRAMEVRDWATKQGLNVGPGVHDWIQGLEGTRSKELELEATTRQLQNTNDELLALARESAKTHEPPKPSFRGAGGHFVPGTTRFQSRQQATVRKASKSGSLKGRFGRRGAGFQSALAIGGGGGSGAASSKVLNV